MVRQRRIEATFGTVAVGLFHAEAGLFFGGGAAQLVTQILGVTVIGAFSFIVTYAVMTVLKSTMGIRVSKEEEAAGIDAASFGVEAYSTFE